MNGPRHLLPALLLALPFGLWPACPLFAHQFDPALLVLAETGEGELAAVWKVPLANAQALQPRLPDGCAPVRALPPQRLGTMRIERTWLDCSSPLAGSTVAVAFDPDVRTEVLVRVTRSGEPPWQAVLRPGVPAATVPVRPSAASVFGDYLRLGVDHILAGPDHLLFVACLVLIAGAGLRRITFAVTGFTLGHSVTLAAASLGLVRVSQRPVEILIALSIVLLARAIVLNDRSSPMFRSTWLIAALMGLLHGLGFAGALREIGFPAEQIAVALVGFNLGVELGQLAFVAALLACGLLLRRASAAGTRGLRARWAGLPIGAVSTFWVLQRTLAG